jgi:hypothetical protein
LNVRSQLRENQNPYKSIMATQLIDNLVKVLADMTEDEGASDAYRQIVTPVINDYFAVAVSAPTATPTPTPTLPADAPVSKAKKEKAPKKEKDTSAPKKIGKKAAYQVYVAENMPRAIEATPNHKERLGIISGWWGQVAKPDQAPYQAKADAFNANVSKVLADPATVAIMATPAWDARRKQIIAESVKVAGIQGAVDDLATDLTATTATPSSSSSVSSSSDSAPTATPVVKKARAPKAKAAAVTPVTV